MEPYHYKEYSTIFDSLASNPEYFPSLYRFIIEIVIPNLKANARVTDFGAGTGLFCAKLLEYLPNLQLTLVEPSPEMMIIARNRLQNRVRYFEMTADAAINNLDQQDAFIFQRSLYVIYQNEAHCKSLFTKLHEKLNPSGIILIQDFSAKPSVEDYKQYLFEECAKTPEQRNELMQQFPILEVALNTFNQHVDEGKFHLINKAEIETLMAETGFEPLISDDDDCYVFRRI